MTMKKYYIIPDTCVLGAICNDLMKITDGSDGSALPHAPARQDFAPGGKVRPF